VGRGFESHGAHRGSLRIEVGLRKILRKGYRKLKRAFVPTAENLLEVLDRNALTANTARIPQIVYQTAESRFVNEKLHSSIQTFRDLNPDLAFKLFDGPARDLYMESQWGNHPIFDVYRRSIYGQMKADIFRYCIVWERGGYYFDLNKGCATSLSSLHPDEAEGIVSFESNMEILMPPIDTAVKLSDPFHLVGQWGFGFIKHHPFLKTVIDKIVELEPLFRGRKFEYPKQALLAMSATGMFTNQYRNWVGGVSQNKIFEAGTDFMGFGQFRLAGSKKAAQSPNHYSRHRDAPIVRESIT
jgi:hypothetical protein